MELLKNTLVDILLIGLSVLAILAIVIAIIFAISIIIEIIFKDWKKGE